jgi:hypothetical protein
VPAQLEQHQIGIVHRVLDDQRAKSPALTHSPPVYR